ncbi:MAG: hypothetical protein HGA37_15770, partial [Lentimicrobium sp.]|nr:hypothetical protein [Lentimicrobium sp.]
MKLKSWIEIPLNSDFPLENLPFGIMKVTINKEVAVTRIGDYIIDLEKLEWFHVFDDLDYDFEGVFSQSSLNQFIAMGKEAHLQLRKKLQEVFSVDYFKGDEDLLVAIQANAVSH